jgi:ubiquinone/menaquinone biosynthesis C-methylase UbiE
MKKGNTSDHWSQYWKTGQLTSLPQDFNSNYTGMIQQQWHQAFDKLNENSHILDVCAGNCAISLLAANYAINHIKIFNITAIDAADINKPSILARFPNQKDAIEKINLIANCQLEDITLASRRYDLITSQYGIEYCDWNLAAQQIQRLLKAKGHFVMIAHSASTEIMKTMQQEKSDYEFLDTLHLFKSFTDYYKNTIKYTAFIKQLKAAQKNIIQRFNSNPSELNKSIILNIDGIISMQRAMLESNKFELIKVQQQYVSAQLRLNDLFCVTQAIAKTPKWHEIFSKHGLKLIEKKKVIQNGLYESGTLFKFIKI